MEGLPDDWRSQIAGEDTKRLGQLDRHKDLGSVLKAGFEAQDKIRKGEVSNGLPDDPTDEQVTAYREANGIPAEAGGYELSLDQGLVLGEEDTRIMEGVYGVAHERNLSTEDVSALTNAMLKGRETEQQTRLAQDGLDHQGTDRQLRESWGGDFEINMNMVRGWVQQMPEGVRELFEGARLADGRAVFNSPELMDYFAAGARKLNPAATVVPGSNNPVGTINEEIAGLEKRMGEDSTGWHKDKAAQKRYLDLVRARDDMNQ